MDATENSFHWLFGAAGIVLIGVGGLFFVTVAIWKPLLVISDEGITAAYKGWHKNFIPWKNVEKFEVLVMNRGPLETKFIGIFVFDAEEIVGAGVVAQSMAREGADWKELPEVLISLALSSVEPEAAMERLQEFHDRYKTR